MRKNSDIILEKFKKELPDQWALYLKHGDKVADVLSPRALELAGAYEDSLGREIEIEEMESAPITEEQARSVLRENPIRGKIATALSSTGRWLPGLGETAMVRGTPGKYQDNLRDQTTMLNAMQAENPKTYGAGIAAGLVSGGAATKGITQLGKLGFAEGVTQMPLAGEDELQTRATSGLLSAALGKGIPAAVKGLAKAPKYLQKKLGKMVRNIPEEATDLVYQSPDILGRATTQADAIAATVSKEIDKTADKYGKMIGYANEAAQKQGRKIDVSKVIEEIDSDIAKLLAQDPKTTPDAKAQVEFLDAIKKRFFTPEDELVGEITVPSQNEYSNWVRTWYESVDPQFQDAARARRMVDTVDEVVDEFERTQSPGLAVSGGQKAGTGKINPNRETLKQRLAEELAQLEDEITTQRMQKPEGAMTMYDERTYQVPASTPGAKQVKVAQPPLKEVLPLRAQNIKDRLNRNFSLFENSTPQQGKILEKYSGMLGQELRESVPGLGAVAKDDAVRETSKLPYDLWANLEGNKTKLAFELFGTKAIPSVDKVTAKEGAEIAENLVLNPESVKKLRELIPDTAIVDDLVEQAKAIYAQANINNSKIKPYFKNRALVDSSYAATGLYNPKLFAARLLGMLGGAAVTTPKAIEFLAKGSQKAKKALNYKPFIRPLVKKTLSQGGSAIGRSSSVNEEQ